MECLHYYHILLAPFSTLKNAATVAPHENIVVHKVSDENFGEDKIFPRTLDTSCIFYGIGSSKKQ
jgi:hypothetical protein